MGTVNSRNYLLPATTTSASITLVPEDAAKTVFSVYNSHTAPVMVITSLSASTAVVPTAGTPSTGGFVPPGQTVQFEKNPNHGIVSFITTSTSGSAYAMFGA